MLYDIEEHTKPILYPEDLVCTTCDFITKSSEKKNALPVPFPNIYKGQIGEIEYKIENVENFVPSDDKAATSTTDKLELRSSSSTLQTKKPATPAEIYYSVNFLDLKRDNSSSNTPFFQNLLIQRKHLIALSTIVVSRNEDGTENFKTPINNPINVKTELQIEAEKNAEKRKFLEIYRYSSISHANFELRYNIGHMVTVQEVLYKEDDKNLNIPIVWPGQVGIILKNCKENKEKEEETVAEVIFLDENNFNLSRLVNYYRSGIKPLVNDLERIYSSPYTLEVYREIRIQIKKKYLIPLYAEELKLDRKGQKEINFLKQSNTLQEPVKCDVFRINDYYIKETKL